MSMKKKALSLILALCMVLALAPTAAFASAPKVTISEQYLFAGKNGDWYTEESYRAAPVVTDLDGDGKLEVLNAAYSLSVMDAATGAEKWRINAGKDRKEAYSDWNNVASGMVFSDFKVLDIDADGKKEIIIGYGDSSVSVLDNQGYFKPGWPKKVTSGSGIRSLAVDDLNGDGKMEIIVGAGVSSAESVWVYHCDGTLAAGWPQLSASQDGNKQSSEAYKSKTAYSYGIFGNGITTGDLNGDGLPEVIVPTDTPYIDAYNFDGSLVKASDIYSDSFGSRMWGKIALWEDYKEEIAHKNEGWGWSSELDGTRAHTYRAELGHAGSVYSDVDGDGKSEVIVTALMVDRTTVDTKGNGSQNINDTKYMTVFILNQDRSRYVNEKLGFDWTSVPNETNSQIRGPLKSYESGMDSMAGNVFSVPVCADLDGDGYQEILFNSYDGRLHCFSLDKKEWCFSLPKNTSTIYEYATPPVCVDLDGDGTKEVIIASWTDCQSANKRTGIYGGTGVNGALYVLSSDGKLLASQDLHNGYCNWEDRDNPSAGATNGVMGSPTVQDVDGDGKYEVLLNTTYYALCAYELGVEKTTPPPPPAPKVVLSEQSLTVDGESIKCEKYNIDGSNYFKLRDLASLLDGTGSQFEVGYDNATSTVTITTGSPYTPNGTELGEIVDKSSTAQSSGQTIVIDGQTRSDLTAYNIGGSNFFQLRELGTALGFDVDYDAATNTAIVNSK